ncbi:unnamed protein product [Sphagnum jensenii]|uniref:Uncharacterized protein n=1 Tax=Sphagnum jensenii TaxID=128206 RepID=A0ABP1BMW0_9BRYO
MPGWDVTRWLPIAAARWPSKAAGGGISTSPTSSIYLSVRNQTTQPSAATTTVLQTMLREAAAAIDHV